LNTVASVAALREHGEMAPLPETDPETFRTALHPRKAKSAKLEIPASKTGSYTLGCSAAAALMSWRFFHASRFNEYNRRSPFANESP
jgi:hypothetical protein